MSAIRKITPEIEALLYEVAWKRALTPTYEELSIETGMAVSYLRQVISEKVRALSKSEEFTKVKKTHGYAAAITVGHRRPRVYQIWIAMRARCENKKNTSYRNYGGRGISVCDRWQSFENFLADMGEPPVATSIDRLDNYGNYEPGNCRWATASEQARNRRSKKELQR